MERERYNILLDEIVNGINKESLDEALSNDRKDKRTDNVLMLIRDSIDNSSLGVYNGMIYHFSGKIYEVVEADDFGNMVYDVMRKIGVPLGDFSKIESFIRVCRRRVNTNKLVLNNDVFVFSNCAYDLNKGEMLYFSNKYVQFNMVEYEYSSFARGYIWNDFLNKVMPNKVHQMILQEFIGSIFIDRHKAKIENMLILKGDGANGKSVVFETVLGILGKQNVSNFSLDELIGGMGNEKKRNLATINGKRLNYASETGNFTIDGGCGLLKALISGEPVEARAMYGDNFTAYDIPLIMINCNKMPKLRDFSMGMRRRITIIPFDVEIPRQLQNKELANELKAEYPAIFLWAMEGRKRFIENGYKLTECDYIDSIIEEYQLSNSNVLEFMHVRKYLCRDENVLDAKPLWRDFNSLYTEYHKWAVYNFEVVSSKKEMSGVLLEYGFRRRRCGRGIQFAIYGESAYEHEIKMRGFIKAVDGTTKCEENVCKFTATKRSDIRTKFKDAYDWDRIVIGCSALCNYIGYNIDISTELANGRLDGTFKYYNGVYVFNLDLIDTMWKPLFYDRIRKSEERKEAYRTNKDLMKAYTQLEIDKHFDDIDLNNDYEQEG